MLIDNGIYVAGLRVDTPTSLEETYDQLADHGGLAWIGLYRPTATELASLAREFALHPLAVEDAVRGHQRSKIERYGETLFIVLRPARYVDEREEVEFGELHIFVGPDFVITIRHAESPDLGRVRRRMESHGSLLERGPEAILYAILDRVVDEYQPIVQGLENDIDEIEQQLFGDRDDDALSRRIYDLSREVGDFQRAVKPLASMLEWLRRGYDKYEVDVEVQRSLRDVLDHVIRIDERVSEFRSLLDKALTVHSALVARRQTEAALAQNDEIKKISSWAAIIFAPTLVGTVYGMNFTNMPELDWRWGYPFAIALMLGFAGTLYLIFKKRRWL
ncbi:magnesium/cobalt transporter CorA [Microbacterium kribbense]|uniref:Magnesium transport protein CorA n=1 Tax=Microbacterium kribbense TaxID=433645 RepID=A0ABP7GH97_9MICO